MAFLEETFTASELPTGGAYDPIPAGWYSASITSATIETTKAGTGRYIKVRYDITGPSHEGRVVFQNLNIRNPNPKAEEIGRQQLGDLMRAIGLQKVQDTDELIGGNLQIKVSIRKSDEYGDSNEVKGCKAASGSRPPSAAAPTARPDGQSAPAAATGSPPWAR